MPRRGRPGRRRLEPGAHVAELDARIAGAGDEASGAALTLEHRATLDRLGSARRAVRGARHALGHAPENGTANQDQTIELIEAEQPDLWRAHQLKGRLRPVLHLRDADEAAARLDEWIEDASSCGVRAMERLAERIERHRDDIVNAVRLQARSAKSESCNTTIKSLIKMARGFRNLDNMFALIYLRCSDIVVPLHNRPQPSAEWQRIARDRANARRRKREEERRLQVTVA